MGQQPPHSTQGNSWQTPSLWTRKTGVLTLSSSLENSLRLLKILLYVRCLIFIFYFLAAWLQLHFRVFVSKLWVAPVETQRERSPLTATVKVAPSPIPLMSPPKTKQRTPRILAPVLRKLKRNLILDFPQWLKGLRKKKVPDKMHELYLTNWFHTMSQTISSLHANSWLSLILPPNLLLHDFAPKATCKNLGLGSRKGCC